MREKNISLPAHWSIDHLCFRVASGSAYEEKKRHFLQFGQLLIESEVNGRPISTFKLSQPIHFLGRKIDLVELPAPKIGKMVSEGFEHIEVVCDQPLSQIKNKYKDIDSDEGGMSKDFNAEFELSLGGMAIKFHHLSFESVVTLEKNKKVFSALKKSEVLSLFRNFSPLLVGTFPLGIQTAESDLDIILSHHNIDEVLLKLENIYRSYPSFESYKANIENSENEYYGLVRFIFEEIPIEIYIENTETTKQRAFLHFQIEEKLLKLGGAKFKEKIMELRKAGMKTEPAFAAALDLQGDCYLKLIEMQSWPEDRLVKILESC